MQGIGANYAVNSESLYNTLSTAVSVNMPVMVWGPPGIGKSSIARQVAFDTGREYIDIRCLLFDPVDLRGVPAIDKQDESDPHTWRTTWATPSARTRRRKGASELTAKRRLLYRRVIMGVV